MNNFERRDIQELPRQVTEKIAAGEVVDRPVSIVKELLENAIDAGASSITVEIKNGGKTYIRVTDNGCGIPREQAELAFHRHATSKIRDAADLDHIETLGFRGEALASIAAVSCTELITKTAEADSGYKVCLKGGQTTQAGDTGCPDGTTLVVSDLFYNTPARMKFLKGDNTESSLIIDFVSKMALAYPAIRIRLINNGNILFSTPGKGDIYTNILTIYSKQIGEKLIRAEGEADNMRLIAYISPPQQSRTNRKHQIFFVNGRFVTSKLLTQAVTDAYAEKLFEGRYPAAFLFLSVLPEKLDVNIHPNKKEVRFDDEKEVQQFVCTALRRALSTEAAVPEIRSGDLPPDSFPHKDNERGQNSFKNKEWKPETGENVEIDIKSFLSTRRRENDKAGEQSTAPQHQAIIAEEPGAYRSGREEPAAGSGPDGLMSLSDPENLMPLSGSEDAAAWYEDGTPVLAVEPPAQIPFDIRRLVPTGVIFDTYITAVDETNFYLIDQHAAHERIFYERLLAEYACEQRHSQMLLTSFVVDMPFAVKNETADFLLCLEKLGYHMEEFGQKAYVVKEIPAGMELSEAEEFLKYFLDNISENFSLKEPKKLEKIIMRSCKSAVKSHDHLKPEEVQALLSDLSEMKNPFSCPHGRPTFIKLSRHEIEKLFKRV